MQVFNALAPLAFGYVEHSRTVNEHLYKNGSFTIKKKNSVIFSGR